MIQCQDRLVGILRLDLHSDAEGITPAYEISIVVAPDSYGHGIGSAALRSARRLMPEAELVAHVSPVNAASRHVFDKAGYRFIGNGWFRSLPSEIMTPLS